MWPRGKNKRGPSRKMNLTHIFYDLGQKVKVFQCASFFKKFPCLVFFSNFDPAQWYYLHIYWFSWCFCSRPSIELIPNPKFRVSKMNLKWWGETLENEVENRVKDFVFDHNVPRAMNGRPYRKTSLDFFLNLF